MKKGIIILLILLLLGIASYFGYQEWNRNRLLNSGDVLLLLNEDEGFYTYSDFLDNEIIDRDYDVLGRLSDFTEEEIAEVTEGYQIRFGALDTVSDPRVPTLLDLPVDVPSEEQRPAWLVITDGLPEAQKNLCDLLPLADQLQQCYIQHHIYNVVRTEQPQSACDGIFIQAQQERCYEMVANNERNAFIDLNGNTLLDAYEGINGNGEEIRALYEQFLTR